MSDRLLVLGGAGFLGANIALRSVEVDDSEVWVHSRRGGLPFRGTRAVSGDLLQDGVVERILDEVEPGIVVNCAALASIDGCERDPAVARAINGELPGRLAVLAAKCKFAFVHISTDAVLGGKPGPYAPDTSPSPINEYGRSKLAGERAVLSADPSALVLRTNIVGWSPSGHSSLLEFFHGRLASGEGVPGFDDVWFRPTSAGTFWDAVTVLLGDGAEGVHHLVGADRLTKFEFGRRVAKTFGFRPELVEPVSVNEGNLGAERGRDLDLEPDPLLVASRPDLIDLSIALQHLRASGPFRDRLQSLTEDHHGRL